MLSIETNTVVDIDKQFIAYAADDISSVALRTEISRIVRKALQQAFAIAEEPYRDIAQRKIAKADAAKARRFRRTGD
jgi:phage gpG-like protein